MLGTILLHAALGLAFAAAANTPPRPGSEQIGTWLLTCPSEGDCQLRSQGWIVPAGRDAPAVALEVVQRGANLVPVVTARSLSMPALLASILAPKFDISLRFDAATPIALDCGLEASDLVCAPGDTGDAMAADQLLAAHTVQVQLAIPGANTMPAQARSLDLQRTAEAEARFRATEPVRQTPPVIAGLDWRGLLGRLLQNTGYARGFVEMIQRRP